VHTIVSGKNREARTFQGVEYLVGATGERMMVTLMKFKRGQVVRPHAHPNEQAGYCLSGSFALDIGGETTRILPHDSYVIPANATHSYEILEDAEVVEVFSPPRKFTR
jgi:quercetin dioxygenase-like cupin family protein